jgi:hypothetical protein
MKVIDSDSNPNILFLNYVLSIIPLHLGLQNGLYSCESLSRN